MPWHRKCQSEVAVIKYTLMSYKRAAEKLIHSHFYRLCKYAFEFVSKCMVAKWNDTNIKGPLQKLGMLWPSTIFICKSPPECSWDHVYILHIVRNLCTNLLVKGQTHYKTLIFTTTHDFILFSCKMAQLCVFKHVQTAVVKVNIIYIYKVDKACIL